MLKKKISRKSSLQILGLLTAGITSFTWWLKTPKKPKNRLAMVMDLDKCIGCHACTVACKSENGVAIGGSRTRVLEQEHGSYPETSRFFLPMMCNHCEDAPCLSACPNDAIIRKDNGLVDINKDKCKGYQICVSACPYGAIYINPDRDPDDQVKDYPARAVGKADKCNFCEHRLEQGLEPACSNTCPTDARIFGDLADPNSKVFQIVNEEKLNGLLPEKGTNPQVYYKGGMPEIFNPSNAINKKA